MPENKIIEIEEFDSLPDEKKMINLYGISYRTHQSVIALTDEVAALKSDCRNKYTTKERVINYASMLGAFVAAVLAGMGFSK